MKIIKKIVLSLFALLCIFYVFIVVSTHYYKDFYPFGIRVALVLTDSMTPTLETNDFVIIKKAKDVSVGDIVVYKEKDSSIEVIHRVIKIDGEKITTKGDANNKEDNPIDKSQIKGVYVTKLRLWGRVISFILKPLNFSIIITIICAFLLIPSKKEFDNNENSKDNS